MNEPEIANTDAHIRVLFIAGADRSGTTFLGDLLGAHPTCLCTPESQFIVNAPQKVMRRDHLPLETVSLYEICTHIKRSWRFKIWNTDFELNSILTQQNGTQLPAVVYELVRSYGRRHQRQFFDVWIDQTPSHIRHTHFLLNLFPNSKLVHLVRDGRAVANSIMPLDFGPNTSSAAASWWIRCVAHGLAAESFWGPARALRIHYEELLIDPEHTLKKICDFAAIEYQVRMLSGGGFAIPEYTLTQHSLVGEPFDSSRAGAWNNNLKPRDIEIFESIAGDFLSNLGYDCRYKNFAKPLGRLEIYRHNLIEWYKSEIVNRRKFISRRMKYVAFQADKKGRK